MAYRFTNTEKWDDAWFCELEQIQKLLFMYLCDMCDIAGFIEINYKKWAFDLGSSKETLQGALMGLKRGLIFSIDGNYIYIRTFLKHQKNYPLNEKNKSHIGIIRRFNSNLHRFNCENIDEFLEGAYKGLQSPTGNGNGIPSTKPTKNRIREFYNEQLELSKQDKFYSMFIGWLFGDNIYQRELTNVLKMEEQVSWKQFPSVLKIHEDTGSKIKTVLEEMDNWLMKNPKAKNSTVLGTLRTFAKPKPVSSK